MITIQDAIHAQIKFLDERAFDRWRVKYEVGIKSGDNALRFSVRGRIPKRRSYIKIILRDDDKYDIVNYRFKNLTSTLKEKLFSHTATEKDLVTVYHEVKDVVADDLVTTIDRILGF